MQPAADEHSRRSRQQKMSTACKWSMRGCIEQGWAVETQLYSGLEKDFQCNIVRTRVAVAAVQGARVLTADVVGSCAQRQAQQCHKVSGWLLAK